MIREAPERDLVVPGPAARCHRHRLAWLLAGAALAATVAQIVAAFPGNLAGAAQATITADAATMAVTSAAADPALVAAASTRAASVVSPSCSRPYDVGGPSHLVGWVDEVGPVVEGQVRARGWVVDLDAPSAPVILRTWTNGGSFDRMAPAVGNRPDVAAAVRGAGSAHGFDVTLTIKDGQAAFALQAFGHGTGHSRVLTWCTAAVPLMSPLGDVNALYSVASGALRLVGWAFDPSTPLEGVDIRVDIDGQPRPLGPAVSARPDVASAYSGIGPAHGFDRVVTGLPPGAVQVCVYALNRGAPAPDTLLGCRWIAVAAKPAGAPLGRLELVGLAGMNGVRAAGWAVDPTRPARPVPIRLSIGGAPGIGRDVDAGPAALPRGDVAVAQSGAGPVHGFDMAVGRVPAGRTEVCAVALGDVGQPDALLGCDVVDVPDNVGLDVIGDLNDVRSPGPGQIEVVGWAFQRSSPATALPVHVYVDGVAGGGAGMALPPVALDRPDVAAVYPDAGPHHGFDSTVSGYEPGWHVVCVYAIGQGARAGWNPLLDCRRVRVMAITG